MNDTAFYRVSSNLGWDKSLCVSMYTFLVDTH